RRPSRSRPRSRQQTLAGSASWTSKLPLFMQLRKQGHIITPQSQHTQGKRPMKDAARTPHRLLLAAGLFACLAPTAAGTAAQPGLQLQPAADAGATTAQAQ